MIHGSGLGLLLGFMLVGFGKEDIITQEVGKAPHTREVALLRLFNYPI